METKNPLISVIVANYNKDRYIRECLDSILDQTYKKLKIIVYDDASNDDSVEVIKRYEENYPDLVKGLFGEKNKGVAKARHSAIMNAEGDYLTTLDSDDYYCNNRKLEKEMELVYRHKEKNGKDIMAFSNIVLVKGDKAQIGSQWDIQSVKEGMIFSGILSRSCMIPRDFIMKREIYFEAGGFDSRFPIYEDWDLKIRLAHKYNFYYTGINGTAYRRDGTGLSSSPIPQHIKWLKRIFKKNLNLVEKDVKKEIRDNFQKFIKNLRENQAKKK